MITRYRDVDAGIGLGRRLPVIKILSLSLSLSLSPPSLLTVLETTAGLLSLDPFRLGDALTQKYMVLRGEEITTPLTVQQVRIVLYRCP